eukprot:5199611-Pyramimonas_sp.AAC.1
MAVYRNPAGWLHVFRAFRLPSPLSARALQRGQEARGAQATGEAEARASFSRIVEAAGLEAAAMDELAQILPRAELHASAGCDAKAAWGRASA